MKLKFKFNFNFRQNIIEHRTDIALITLSAVSFGFFAYGSIYFREMSGISGPVAQMMTGAAERKANDDSTYTLVIPPALLFNMDALWVGKKGQASILMEHGAELELGEKTFILLKRPFKSSKRDDDQIVVLKGSVHIKSRTLSENQEFVPEKPVPTLPEFDKAPVGRIIPNNLYPTNDVILYMRPEKKVELTFAWPEPLKGYLVIENKNTAQAIYVDVNQVRSVKATLDQNTTYFWQVIDAAHKVLIGPFRFDLNVLTNETTQKAKEKSVRPVEIIWE